MPAFRPRRTPWPWEALASAVVGQLIEADRAARIERRIVGRWGARLGDGREALRDVPGGGDDRRPGAGRTGARWTWRRAAPMALRRVAREVAAGAASSAGAAADRRLLALPQIGPWTVQCLGLFGRGDMDSLPAGDLAYIKLVGRLAVSAAAQLLPRSKSSTHRMSPIAASSGRSPWLVFTGSSPTARRSAAPPESPAPDPAGLQDPCLGRLGSSARSRCR